MRRLFAIFLLLASEVAFAGWAKFYGNNVRINDLKPASDGGVVVLG